MTQVEFTETIKKEAKAIGIELNQEQLDKLFQFKNLVVTVNENINLTAITEDEDFIYKHIIDSMTIIPQIKKGDKLLDVGSGAGFPGVVIAIVQKDAKIVMMDSLEKRVNFLNEATEKLQLNNAKAIHARAEEYAHKSEYREAFDVVVARAVASLNVLTELLVPYAKLSGRCVFMKSVQVEEEEKNAKNAFEKLSVIKKEENTFNITTQKGEQLTRKVLVYTKSKSTLSQYPRMYSKIKKLPL